MTIISLYLLLLVVSHKCFEFIRVVGDALRAEETATVLRDQDIILDADAAEVLIGLELVEVQELLAMSAGLPVVDEGWNEVDAGLVG